MIYGKREQEFEALFEWLVHKCKEGGIIDYLPPNHIAKWAWRLVPYYGIYPSKDRQWNIEVRRDGDSARITKVQLRWTRTSNT